MKAKLFKTKKLAEAYICENYSEMAAGTYTRRNSYITEDSDYETDMVNLQWSGETPAWIIEDSALNTVDVIAWWEEGDDKYELFVGGKLYGGFDNIYDAREAYDKAVDTEEYKDEDEEEVFEVRLFCNGEDISD